MLHAISANRMNRLLPLVLIFLLFSCRLSYQDICGTYELKNFPKSTLVINSDDTFVFTQNYLSPYQHPFPHHDEYYFRTMGNWIAVPRLIKLTGTKDRIDYSNVNILSTEPSINEQSNFKFVDEYGDTVPILSVQYSDSTSVSVLHHTMDDFDEDLRKRDSLQFIFFGYQPWTFIHGEQKNNNYTIEILPAFRSNEIDSLYLKLRKNVIGSKKLKYRRKKACNI